MANTRIFEAGDMDSWKHWEFSHPSLKQATPGKVMLGERLGLCGMEVSLNFSRRAPLCHSPTSIASMRSFTSFCAGVASSR